MIATITIALWAHLFCGPWSESGKVFGWLKAWACYTNPCTEKARVPYIIRHPLIECSACHSVWVAIIYQAVTFSGHFDVSNILQILCSSFGAILLEDFKEIRDKWKYN